MVAVDELFLDPADDGVEVAVELDVDDEDVQEEGREEEGGDEVGVDEDGTWVLVPASSCSNWSRHTCWCEASTIPVPHNRYATNRSTRTPNPINTRPNPLKILRADSGGEKDGREAWWRVLMAMGTSWC